MHCIDLHTSQLDVALIDHLADHYLVKVSETKKGYLILLYPHPGVRTSKG